MTQNWTKKITRKNEDDWKFQKIYTKDIINGYVYIEKKIINFKNIYGI